MKAEVTVSGGANYSLGKIADGLTNRRPLNAAIGKRGEVELREHFLERNQEPNKKGWPSQDFWGRIRKSTSLASVDQSGATIAIGDPAIAQKIYGGEITPKEGKYLTLPAIAEAAGRSARTFNNLEPLVRWINGSRRAIALVERAASEIKYGRARKDGSRSVTHTASRLGGKVFYWLVEKVRQKKDPRALPSREKMEGALRDEAGAFIQDIAR
ncbi:MAG: hypothetical protein LC642_06225 [Verrucomicrobiaceae bacterium]|nr:hypothetical protein [Verrucomicrobiaceae bacterium]